MIVFCGVCGAKIEVEEDHNEIYNYCADCEHDLEMEKKNEESRNNISRNGPWHNV